MFRLQKSIKGKLRSRDKFDFRFSEFQVLQVPKGWAKVCVNLVSVETGKSVGKLEKAVVNNGGCEWREALSHSIYVSRDDSSKEHDESQGIVKLVVSSGTTKNSALGEATIDLAELTGCGIAAQVSLPLKRCSSGTVLQMKAECLTPRPKTRDDESNSNCSSFREPSLDLSSDSTEIISSVSDTADTETLPSPSIRGSDPLDGSICSEDLSASNTCYDSLSNSSVNRPSLASDSVEKLDTEAEMSESNIAGENTKLLEEISKKKNGNNSEKPDSTGDGGGDSRILLKEIKSLRGKVQELENDCVELTNENLELIFKINDLTKTRGRECASVDSSPSHDSEVSDPKFPIEEDTKRKRIEDNSSSNPESSECFLILNQVDMAFRLLGKPRIKGSYDEIVENASCNVSGDYLLSLMQEMNQLLELRIGDFDEKSRTVSNFQTKFDQDSSHTNMSFEERVSSVEIQDEIMELQMEMDVQVLALKQVSEDFHQKLLVAQEENQLLREEIKETANLRSSNSETPDSHEKCSAQAVELHEAKEESLYDCSKKLISLEEDLTSVIEYFSHTEHVLETEIGEILRENTEWVEKFLHKTRELEKEVELLNSQLSEAHKEKERISFEACSEVSLLLADKAELQAALQESQITEQKLKQKLQESESKVEELLIQVAASRQSHERLMIDHEKTVELLTSYKKNEEKLRNISELQKKPVAGDCATGKLLPRSGTETTKEDSIQNGSRTRKYDRTKSSLEAELKDIRERYLEMSLKYAEVEAQREGLVMKLREARGNKRWF